MSGLTQSAIAIGVILSLVVSITGMSSAQSIWTMINQYQLFLTLPLVGWYMTPELIKFIESFEFALGSFSFIPFEDILIFETLYNWMNLPQSNSNFESVGLESGSTLINQLGMLLLLVLLVLLHLCYVGLKHWFLWKIESKPISTLIDKFDNFMTYNVYIRITMEIYLFATLSSFSEAKAFKHNSAASITSLIFSFIFCFGCIFVCVLSIVCYIKDFKKPLDQTDQRFLELYADLKDKKIARFYSNMYYFRRFLM